MCNLSNSTACCQTEWYFPMTSGSCRQHRPTMAIRSMCCREIVSCTTSSEQLGSIVTEIRAGAGYCSCRLVQLFIPCSNAQNLPKFISNSAFVSDLGLVAGGGFELQSRIDST